MSEQTQNIEQNLEKTSLGHYINHHRKSMLLAGASVVFMVLAGVFYQYRTENNLKESLAKAYALQNEIEKPFLAGSLSKEEAVQKLNNVAVEVAQGTAMQSIVFSVVNKLAIDGNDKEVVSILDRYLKFTRSSETAHMFMGLKLAVSLENIGDNKAAIKTLESVLSGGHKVVEARVYLDLGRLYMKEGDKEKSRKNFEYIIENHKDTETAKLAKLFLAQLG